MKPRAATALALGLFLAGPAWADPPQLKGIKPFGVPRGVATDLTINGGNLAGNPQLVAPFPVASEPLPGSDAGNAKLKVTVPAEVAVGVYIVRVKTDDGISNPLLFSVGQVPQVEEKEDNGAFDAAQPVAAPTVVEGQLAGNDVDYFKFSGKKGQRIVVDAFCSRIGSGVDPQIRLTTADRKFVAAADDSPGLLTDARLAAELPEDTDYVVEISDTKYQGGGRAIYRLLIGPLPAADEVFPLGGRRGETVGFELRGGTLPGTRVAAATLATPKDDDNFRLRATNQALGLVGPSDPVLEVETLAPLEVGELPELREPADPEAPPLRTSAPVTINGRIDPPGDEDRVILAVSPGQRLHIHVNAAELGSALDGTLQVLGAKDAVLANADDSTIPAVAPKNQKRRPPGIPSPDPVLDFNVPNGVNEITIALRDLEGRGGVGFPYRLTVEPASPTFQVTLNDAEVSIPRGGTAAVGVTILRQGYNGPITLNVEDPPAGLSVRPGLIAEGQAVGVLTLTAAADTAFNPAGLRVVGTAQGPSGPIRDAASKLLIFAQQGGGQAAMPTSLAHQIGLAAAPAQAQTLTLEAPAEPVEVVHGYGAPIPIKINRAPEGEGDLAFTPLPLPAGLAVPEAKVGAKDAQANPTVNAAPEAPLGTSTIALTAKGKIAGKDRVLAAPAILLNVVRPAAVELAATALEIKAGATAEVKGKVVRKGPFKEPVNVKLDGLPAGLKAEPVTVAPDAAEFVLKVVADPGIAAATAQAKVNLAFQINKKDYATPPATLEVKVVK